jgi:hypothetical protein
MIDYLRFRRALILLWLTDNEGKAWLGTYVCTRNMPSVSTVEPGEPYHRAGLRLKKYICRVSTQPTSCGKLFNQS